MLLVNQSSLATFFRGIILFEGRDAMKNWKYIINCIEKLETLKNGKGTEIEFIYNGKIMW